MIPVLILNELSDFSEQYIYNEIQKYTLSGACCLRIGGMRYKRSSEETIIFAWQCNLADVQNFDVRLPTIIRVHLNSKNEITSINLHETFKGSQGIPCSQKYLDRRLKNELTGEKFSMNNPKIKDPLYLACRHVYELLYGAAAFMEYCEKNSISNGYVSECTQAFQEDDSIDVFDNISVNGSQSVTKIKIANFKDNIKYGIQGAIERTKDLEVSGYYYDNNEFKQIKTTQAICSESNKEFLMKFMKNISAYWINSGKSIGILEHFYFSQIWAPTFYGIITQAFALSIFNKNYAYFQHCISGIQHIDNRPCCIGIAQNIYECNTYFKDFLIEDLY
jgi:hypothetical protein